MKVFHRFKKTITILWVAAIFTALFFVNSARAAEAEPIVFVPGVLGSWHWLVLMDESDEPIIDTNGWSFPPGFQNYDNVIAAFKAAVGEDKVFTAFYDWRRPNEASAQNYLKPVIDRAKAVSPTGKVDIVTHSMGGLVARAYIQSSDYENDVDQLITLGTPHYGSSDSYLAWEGADISFYEPLIRLLLRAYLFYHNPEGIAFQHLVLRRTAPSVKELLPTYDFLKDKDGDAIATSTLQEQNPLLPLLNTAAGLRALYERVKVTTIAGAGEPTLNNISVEPPSDLEKALSLWPDGKPNPLPPPKDSTEGDNRVLKSSAWLPDIADEPPPPVFFRAPTWWERLLAFIFSKAQAQFFGPPFTQPTRLSINSCHICLPTDAVNFVLRELGLEQVGDFPPFVEPDGYLAYYFASPVSVSVTDPQGRLISKNENTIPGAVYSDDSTTDGPRLVLISNPLPGEYKIELTGTDNGEFHIGAQFFGAATTELVTTTGNITTNQTLTFTTTISTSGGITSITPPTLVPPPRLIIDKVTYPAGDPQIFHFNTAGAGYAPFDLADQQTPNDQILNPGTYTISEVGVAGWDLTSATCVLNQNQPAPYLPGTNLTLNAGDTTTCVFTNTKRGRIIVDKVTVPSGVLQSFNFTTTGTGYTGFSLTDQATPNDQALAPGLYSVSEIPAAGWTLTSVVCDNQQNPVSINLQAGQTVRCVFTNTRNPRFMANLATLLNQLIVSGDLHDATRQVRGRTVVIRPKTWLVQTLTRYGRAYELLDRRCASGERTLINLGLDSEGIRSFWPFPRPCQFTKGQLVKLMYQAISANTPGLLTPAGASALREFLDEVTGG